MDSLSALSGYVSSATIEILKGRNKEFKQQTPKL